MTPLARARPSALTAAIRAGAGVRGGVAPSGTRTFITCVPSGAWRMTFAHPGLLARYAIASRLKPATSAAITRELLAMPFERGDGQIPSVSTAVVRACIWPSADARTCALFSCTFEYRV